MRTVTDCWWRPPDLSRLPKLCWRMAAMRYLMLREARTVWPKALARGAAFAEPFAAFSSHLQERMPMGPQVDPVASDLEWPKEADVVIVGGGIIGAASAFFLAERGLKVVLCEKGSIAGEQSSRNWGWCRQARRDPREFRSDPRGDDALARPRCPHWRRHRLHHHRNFFPPERGTGGRLRRVGRGGGAGRH